VVQAFPDAWKNSLSSGVKLIFGMEGYLLPDSDPIDIPEEFVSFFALTDKNGSKTERLIEIAAVKYQNGSPKDRFHSYINSGIDLSANFTIETGITNEDIRNAPSANQAIPMLLEFIGRCILVTHDPEKLNILRRYSKLFNKETAERYIDTSLLAHYLFRDKKDLSLAALAEDLFIPVNGTGACALSEVCAELLLKMIPVIKDRGSSKLPLMAGLPSSKEKGTAITLTIL
jgi:DNA polymerase-3 subunit alpha (Gram-positive type)